MTQEFKQASDKQKQFIMKLAKTAQPNMKLADLDGITSSDASQLIDDMMDKKPAKAGNGRQTSSGSHNPIALGLAMKLQFQRYVKLEINPTLAGENFKKDVKRAYELFQEIEAEASSLGGAQ